MTSLAPERRSAPADAAAAAADLTPQPWVVRAVHRELPTTVTLDLAPADGSPPPRFLPAQYSMLTVIGVGEVPISISTDPADPDRHGYTVRAAGAVTTALCGLQPGDVVGVRGPLGNSWAVEDAVGSDVVFLGGGIGLAPLRPAIYDLMSQRDRYGRVAILIGARTPGDVLFADELAQWRARFDVDVRVSVDRPDRGWRGEVGVVPKLLPQVNLDWPAAMAFVCGPDVMMRAAAGVLLGLGARAERVRLTLERNMKCGVGLCGHCQLGRLFVCEDGPVVPYSELQPFYGVKEI
jgi:NAD(P)H-flavin reductase